MNSSSMSFEDQTHCAGQQIIGNGYGNIELPEVGALTPRPTQEQEGERTLSDVHLRSRTSKGFPIPPYSRPRETGDSVNNEVNAQLVPSSPVTTLYTVSHLVFFSIFGTLARLGLEAITFYPSAPIISAVVWANLGGSFIVGFLVEDRRIFREEWGKFSSCDTWSFHPTAMESNDKDEIRRAFRNHDKVKRTIPLFIGLATGFCGCFTSFSSFIRDAFLALSNGLPSPAQTPPMIPSRNGGYGVESVLAIIIIHVTAPLSAFRVGGHLASAIDPVTPTLPFRSIRTVLDPLSVLLGFGSWTGAVLLTIFPPRQYWRGRVTFALVFAPVGCLVRFYAAKYLNGRIPSFPLGTFAVNISGTIILGICFDLQHARPASEDAMSCQVLQGLMDGFCGSATTVSTWVAELSVLTRRQSYIYGSTTVVVAVSFLIVIMGSLQWSRGFQTPVCV